MNSAQKTLVRDCAIVNVEGNKRFFRCDITSKEVGRLKMSKEQSVQGDFVFPDWVMSRETTKEAVGGTTAYGWQRRFWYNGRRW